MTQMMNEKIIERALKAYHDWNAKNPAAFVGMIENPDAFFSDSVCRCNCNVLSLYLKIECDCIINAKYRCDNCDLYMFAVSDAICEMIMGRKIDEALKINVEAILKILGVSSKEEDINDQFKGAKRILETAIYNYIRNTSVSEVQRNDAGGRQKNT